MSVLPCLGCAYNVPTPCLICQSEDICQEGVKVCNLLTVVSTMNPDQGPASCDGSKDGPPLSANNAAAEKVFSNTLVWKIIGSYLNVGDLKACRLVNSEFHGMVMKETNFLQRCVVSLKPDQITRNIFGITTELWKNVLLKFQSPGGGSYCNFSDKDLHNLEWLCLIIANAESLSLRMKKGTKGGNLFPLLKRLLKASKKLTSLAMEPIFLIFGTAGHFEEVKDILENLEEFEILQPSPTWLFDIHGWAGIQPWLLSPDFVKQLANLRVVKSYCPQKASSTSNTVECPILTSVLNIIAHQNSKTLKHVTLCESDTTGTVAKFFEVVPLIQEIDFSVWLFEFPKEILRVIEKRSDRLRKVKLQGLIFPRTNWGFLEKTKLEEFQLGVLGPFGRTLPSEALNYLPSTIRRLFLRGALMSNPVPGLTRLDPTLVTQLTFIDIGNCFGDDAIQYIRENFVMLCKLNVTNAKKVTDAGFIGSSSGAGSLSGIKGLRTLILRECGSISDATLREIRFLELCHLDLAYNEKLTEDGIEKVLSNNSSLETLLTSCKNVHHKREHLCASHPRLSAVIYRGLKTKKKAA